MPLSSLPSHGSEAMPVGAPIHHAGWDAGDLACGELVLELRLRMRSLNAGQTLRLSALDPGAPADIPAWCRMTRHHLVFIDPVAHLYFIQRP